jgi:hypothetical protein
VNRISLDNAQAESALEGIGGKLKPNILAIAFWCWVLTLAVYQFSENTADPDLWGHVVFGRQMLRSGSVEKTENYSWTARGQPFVNHEFGADLILGATHRLLGGPGILLLKMSIGLLTFALCLRLGAEEMPWPRRAVAWMFGALAVVEISFGFAARPQIFTALFMALELWLLRRIHAGRWLQAGWLPLLFLCWINIHGGALAGFGLLVLTAVATGIGVFWRRQRDGRDDRAAAGQVRKVASLWLAMLAAGGAMFCNPWGATLLRWLVGSVLWLRPEIDEWNPPAVGWDHAALFILIALTCFAWAFSRRPKSLWELAACAAFAVLALRSARNTPLFCLVTLALTPRHLADATAPWADKFARWHEWFRRPRVRSFITGLLGVCSAAVLAATFTLHKVHPLTMEVPLSRYPMAAINFMRGHDLRGNLLVFFDWGDLTIFALPGCAPSIDGRLDACYSRALIAAHWRLYNGEPVDPDVLNLRKADLAMLPSKLAGALALGRQPEWKAVYLDELAVVLVRGRINRFARLSGMDLPIQGPKEAILGSAAFPDAPAEP